MQEIKDLIKSMVDVPIIVITGMVKEVDEANMLCVVEPDEEGADYNNVRLRAQDNEKDTGVIEVPKVGSSVAIARLYNDSDTFFVILRSEVEKIVIKGEKLNFVMNIENTNGIDLDFNEGKVRIRILEDDVLIDTVGETKFNSGGNGGMVIAGPVASYFNELYTKLNNLILAYNSHIHILTGSTIAPTLAVATAPNSPPSIENSKVKH